MDFCIFIHTLNASINYSAFKVFSFLKQIKNDCIIIEIFHGGFFGGHQFCMNNFLGKNYIENLFFVFFCWKRGRVNIFWNLIHQIPYTSEKIQHIELLCQIKEWNKLFQYFSYHGKCLRIEIYHLSSNRSCLLHKKIAALMAVFYSHCSISFFCLVCKSPMCVCRNILAFANNACYKRGDFNFCPQYTYIWRRKLSFIYRFSINYSYKEVEDIRKYAIFSLFGWNHNSIEYFAIEMNAIFSFFFWYIVSYTMLLCLFMTLHKRLRSCRGKDEKVRNGFDFAILSANMSW